MRAGAPPSALRRSPECTATEVCPEGTYRLEPADAWNVQPETRQQKARVMSSLFTRISQSWHAYAASSARPSDDQRRRESIVHWIAGVLNPAWSVHETLLKSRRTLGYSRPARAIANKART